MNKNKKTNSNMFYLATLLVFIGYKYIPAKIQIMLPLFLGIYNIGYIVYLIRIKSFWENIVRTLVLSIGMIIIFVAYYKSAFKLDNLTSLI